MTRKTEPHDPVIAYSILKERVIKKIAPGLLDEGSREKTLATIAFVLLAIVGGIGAGYYVDTHYIDKPWQVWGVCPPPAFINPNGCFTKVSEQVTVNGQATYTVVNTPAGYYLNPLTNSTGGNATK